jgi:transcriptional antiterminator RfaH
MPENCTWYLVRTKPNKERCVEAQLTRIVPEVFVPLLSSGASSSSKRSLSPLFPQYVFVRTDLSAHYFSIRYASGVVSFVANGLQPLAVSPAIVESIRSRSTDGVVRIVRKPFRTGEAVRIVAGPFRGFEAVFDRYLSGADRVAILLNAVEGHNLRLVAKAENIAR